MLPIETLLQTTKAMRMPIAEPQQIQQAPVTEQKAAPAGGQGAGGDAAAEFIKAIMGALNPQQGQASPQTPVNAPGRASAGPQLSVPLEALRPPQAQIQPDNNVLLPMLLKMMGVI